MDFYVMTLFPELIDGISGSSILGRAKDKGILNVIPVNFRNYSKDKHLHVDDYPYGGGAGMLIKPEPVYDCYKAITEKIGKTPRVIYMSPIGKTLNQDIAKELAKEENLIILCGHYEGIDERVIEEIVTDQISIGDYVLTGGELPAMVLIDAVSRMIPGVLSENSGEDESFYNGLLEYPQYTRPEEFMGKKVPEILLSGHHSNIERWRRNKSLERTLDLRPELIEKAELDKKDLKFINEYRKLKENEQL